MDILIKNGKIFDGMILRDADIWIENGEIRAVGANLNATEGATILDARGCAISPGFTDLHAHLREPGFSQKETIATGTAAAAAGGFTRVCAMPNLSPVPHSIENLQEEEKLIKEEAIIQVLPYGALTRGENGQIPADITEMASHVIGFTDDGVGVQDTQMMAKVMRMVSVNKSMVAAHCEVASFLPENGTCVQENSDFAKKYGYIGFSDESEWSEVKRDIILAKELGCRLHICHASTEKTFDLVRRAKMEGLPVTCEVTPHNLLLSCSDITEDKGRFKMNPPLRTRADVLSALAAVQDGTVDAIATDHAPHTQQEKQGTFAESANGVVGLETAFAAVYTGLVKAGKLRVEKMLQLLTVGPSRVIKMPVAKIEKGQLANLTVIDLLEEHPVNPKKFLSKGRATPFENKILQGWPILTLYQGNVVYSRNTRIE